MSIFSRVSKVSILDAQPSLYLQQNNSENAEQIVSHFSRYFQPVIADTQEHAEQSFRIRHNVYCEELKFEATRASKLESDNYDAHSLHCLIQHRPSGIYAGTVRVITINDNEESLPIANYCGDAITDLDYHPNKFSKGNVCEISRLAVPANYRRRKMDNFDGAATGGINSQTYSETELRCFPFIAVGLYLSATSLLLRMNINHCFVMVEPRLARSMRFVGLPFRQIGDVVEYHGRRAPFYIDPNAVPDSLTAEFRMLLDNIDHAIGDQL